MTSQPDATTSLSRLCHPAGRHGDEAVLADLEHSYRSWLERVRAGWQQYLLLLAGADLWCEGVDGEPAAHRSVASGRAEQGVTGSVARRRVGQGIST